MCTSSTCFPQVEGRGTSKFPFRQIFGLSSFNHYSNFSLLGIVSEARLPTASLPGDSYMSVLFLFK